MFFSVRRRPAGRHVSASGHPAGRSATLRIAAVVLGVAMVAGTGAVAAAQAATPEATVSALDAPDSNVPTIAVPNASVQVDDGSAPVEGTASAVDGVDATAAAPAADLPSPAVQDLPALQGRARALAARLVNPPLPAKCGLSIAIVLDLSNSLSDAAVTSSKTAAKSVVGSLSGTPSSVGVFTFATFAPDRTNADIAKTSVSTGSGAAFVKNSIDQIRRVPSNVGGTNWDAALRQIPQSTYDIVLFVTDGNPTAYGTPGSWGNSDYGTSSDPIDLSTAVTAADALKSSGTFVIGLAVGSAINLPNIKAISGARQGTDYFQVNNYDQLTAQLAEIALKNCQGTVSIVKQVRDLDGNLLPAAGWTFTSRAGDNVSPGNAVTGNDGAVNFRVNEPQPNGRAVQFSEGQRLGYALETQNGMNTKCVNNVTGLNVPSTNSGALGFTLNVKPADAISCEVINKMLPSAPIVKKASSPVSGTEVQPGETIVYTLSFGNEGYFPTKIDYVDHLADVFDDAVFNNNIEVVGTGLAAVRDGETIRITGAVGPGKTVTVTYSATVKSKGFGNGVARNYLVPAGSDPVCTPKKNNCTEHPIPGTLEVKKSADPKTGSYVAPGSVVKYTLSFTNSGASTVDVNHVDHLADVLDDAEFTTGSLVSGDGLTAARDEDSIRIAGSVKAESTLTVNYTVRVKTSNFGNGMARNFLVPEGDNPPESCDPEIENCTEHPILGSLAWNKVDGNAKALSGSEWELAGPGESGRQSIKDCVADSAAACLGPDLNPVAGELQVGGLAWGDYTLRETRAPAGYQLDATEHQFTIGGGTTLQLVVHLDPIVNEQQPAFTLPLTGGTGSSPYLMAGGGLLSLAVLLGAWVVVRKVRANKA